MSTRKKILIAPLNWGIGHATRCIPIIAECISHGHEVIIGSDGDALAILKKEFPELEFVNLPSYHIHFNPQKWKFGNLIKQIPRLLSAIRKEKLETQKLVHSKGINYIISDNRYGVYSNKIESILITHQLDLSVPISFLANRALHFLLRPFNQIWIPDFKGSPNLSGKLGHQDLSTNRLKYIGPLSRLSAVKEVPPKGLKTKGAFTLVLISGPEPARSQFEELILKHSGDNLVIVGGSLNSEKANFGSHHLYYPFLNSENIKWLLTHAENIICRSGYSTLMDLFALNRKAVLIPTPGQPEQQYLAQYFVHKHGFTALNQSEFTLKEAMKKAAQISDSESFK